MQTGLQVIKLQLILVSSAGGSAVGCRFPGPGSQLGVRVRSVARVLILGPRLKGQGLARTRPHRELPEHRGKPDSAGMVTASLLTSH